MQCSGFKPQSSCHIDDVLGATAVVLFQEMHMRGGNSWDGMMGGVPSVAQNKSVLAFPVDASTGRNQLLEVNSLR